MSTAQKTELRPDTRVRVAGHPLPWKLAVDQASGELLAVLDADERPILDHLHERRDAAGNPIMPDSFYRGLVKVVNRMGEVQAYLSGLTSLTIKRHPLELEPGFVDPEKEKQAFQNLERKGFMEAGVPWDEVKARTDPVARIAALEAALTELVDLLLPITIDFGGGWNHDLPLNDKARAILDRVGLAHLSPGNLDKAEEAVSS